MWTDHHPHFKTSMMARGSGRPGSWFLNIKVSVSQTLQKSWHELQLQSEWRHFWIISNSHDNVQSTEQLSLTLCWQLDMEQGLDKEMSHLSTSTHTRGTRLNIVQRCLHIYGSVSAGREKWPFNVIFFLKVEPPCDQTWWDSLVFSILSCFSYVLDAENTLVGPVGPF